MKESALKLAETQSAPFAKRPPVQQESATNIINYPAVTGVSVDPKELARHGRKRRRKLMLFIKLETIAFFFLILTLVGITSPQIRENGLTTTFQIAMISAALIVAIIPIIFYGPTRQKYRYRASGYRVR